MDAAGGVVPARPPSRAPRRIRAPLPIRVFREPRSATRSIAPCGRLTGRCACACCSPRTGPFASSTRRSIIATALWRVRLARASDRSLRRLPVSQDHEPRRLRTRPPSRLRRCDPVESGGRGHRNHHRQPRRRGRRTGAGGSRRRSPAVCCPARCARSCWRPARSAKRG